MSPANNKSRYFDPWDFEEENLKEEEKIPQKEVKPEKPVYRYVEGESMLYPSKTEKPSAEYEIKQEQEKPKIEQSVQETKEMKQKRINLRAFLSAGRLPLGIVASEILGPPRSKQLFRKGRK